jgi:hypothetical protein
VFSAAYAVFATVGVLWAVIMRAARPESYAGIGRGAEQRVLPESSSFPVSHSLPRTSDVAHHS